MKQSLYSSFAIIAAALHYVAATKTVHDSFTFPQTYDNAGIDTPVPGACSRPTINRLESMYPQMQDGTSLAIDQLSKPVAEALREGFPNSFFGILPALPGNTRRFPGDALQSIGVTLKHMDHFLADENMNDLAEHHPQMLCNSNFMEYLREEQLLPARLGLGNIRLRDMRGYDPRCWYFYIAHLGPRGVFYKKPKKGASGLPYPSNDLSDGTPDDSNPTFCAQSGALSLGIKVTWREDSGRGKNQGRQHTQGIIILCPKNFKTWQQTEDGSSWSLENAYDDDLNTQRETPGTPLAAMQPTWLAWYEAILILLPAGPKVMKYRKWYKPKDPTQSEPLRKDDFVTQKSFARDPLQCMSIAAYSKAEVADYSSLRTWKPLSNVPTFAWYVVGNFLQVKTGQDWYTGQCEDRDAASSNGDGDDDDDDDDDDNDDDDEDEDDDGGGPATDRRRPAEGHSGGGNKRPRLDDDTDGGYVQCAKAPNDGNNDSGSDRDAPGESIDGGNDSGTDRDAPGESIDGDSDDSGTDRDAPGESIDGDDDSGSEDLYGVTDGELIDGEPSDEDDSGSDDQGAFDPEDDESIGSGYVPGDSPPDSVYNPDEDSYNIF